MMVTACACQRCGTCFELTMADEQVAGGRRVEGAATDADEGGGMSPAASRGGLRGGSAAASGSGKGMDESFVVLNNKPAGGASTVDTNALYNVSVSARMRTLEKLFDFVEAEGEIESPLCLQCSATLRKELEAAIQEAEEDADDYEAAALVLDEEARRYEESARPASTEDEAAASLAETADSDQNACEQEQRWSRRVARLRAQLDEVEKEGESLDATEKELDALEERYWQEYNDHVFKLQQHRHARDAVLARIETTGAALEALRRTNVFNDVFRIWHDGPYGTISGFRLGRVGAHASAGGAGGGADASSSSPVEWDEINAAWGQCVLLLNTMATACKFTFTSYRLLPLGSYSKVIDDRKATLELYGPISSLNPFKRTNFDRAMVGFLRCLQELAEFATTTDRAALADQETVGADAQAAAKPFSLPYAIEADKINGKTIKLTFNREDRWTAALKLMLADLKCLLVWCARHVNAAGD